MSTDVMTDARAGWRSRRGDMAFGRFGYHPGLDGIRGLAVVAIFSFHAGSPLFRGGPLGVSVFFTLSGYLITRLLLDEGVRSATLDLPKFWARRLRRLLPAALAGIGLVLVLSVLAALQVDPHSLSLDVFGALGYVANWRFLLAGSSYGELFQSPSPLLHYWSLAVEEQFYLLLPLTVWAVLRFASSARDFRLRLRNVLLIGIGISLATTFIAAAAGNYDFVYYSLPSRMGELLVGGVFATFVGVARVGEGRAPRWLTAVGFSALLAIGVLCTIATPTDGWIGRGGLTPFAVLSGTMIVAATPAGPLASLLAFWPFRMLGIISYGLYLYHWPIILWLSPDRTGLQGTELVVLQAAVAIGLAIVSYRLLERPIRTGALVHGSKARVAAPVGIVAMALCGFLVTSALSTPSSSPDFAAEARALERSTRQSAGRPVAPDAPPRLAYYGDSTALRTVVGLAGWNDATNSFTLVPGSVGLGCGLTRGGSWRVEGQVYPMRDARDCAPDWATAWPADILANHVELAVLQFGPADIADRRLAGETVWRAPGDPTYDDYLRSELTALFDVFTTRGVPVVALTTPYLHYGINQIPERSDPANDPERVDIFNRILREVARTNRSVAVVDLGRWVDERPGGSLDTSLRPDGVHFSVESAIDTVGPWLGPEIVRAAARARVA